jgi:Haem-binding domain
LKRKLKWLFVVFVAGFALLQLTNPSRTNPRVVSDLMASNPPPPQVAAILHAACYDCHSSETRWPWYSHIAPMSWLIASDVKEGREHLNLSDWPNDNPTHAAKRLEDMSDEIGSGEMPLPKYIKIHAEARLTGIQRKKLTDWLDAESARLKSIIALPPGINSSQQWPDTRNAVFPSFL